MTTNRVNKKPQLKKPRGGKSKWSKDNPHPKHIQDPEHFTYLGKPRCQGRNPHTGRQCTKTATINGEFCACHTDVEEKVAKGGLHRFDECSGQIVALVRQGYTFTTAAARVGISPRVITDWRRMGKEELASGKDDGKFAKWWYDLEEARIYACSLVENALFGAALGGNVSAQVKWLECRMPEVWNAKRVMEISVETQHRLDVNCNLDVGELTDEQLRAKVKEIAQAVEISIGNNIDDATLQTKLLEVHDA